VIALDTSVVIPMFAAWHEAHRSSILLLAEEPRLPAHVAIESFSVLTRLPTPHRVPASVVVEFLDRVFPPATRLVPDGPELAAFPRTCMEAGIAGGAVYDALVAMTVRRHGATLVTRDRRALGTYRAFGAAIRMTA
jgi:predicted nucleic acid-binding protein